MGEQTYQIKDYVHDEVVAFTGALNVKGDLSRNEDNIYLTDRYKLESYNPEDTIPIAIFIQNLSCKTALTTSNMPARFYARVKDNHEDIQGNLCTV